jgi:hypothetical protein
VTDVTPRVQKWMTRDPQTFLSNVQTRKSHVLWYLHQTTFTASLQTSRSNHLLGCFPDSCV